MNELTLEERQRLSEAADLLYDYASLLETLANDFPDHQEQLERVNKWLYSNE